VVVVTHDLDAAERHADRAVVLHRGRIAASGPPSRLADLYRQVTGEDHW
jgi:ABC-type hemin transport system ATPase subunit